MRRFLLVLGLIVWLGLWGAPHTAQAARTALPPHFTRVTVLDGLNGPTDVAFASGKTFITEKGGTIRLIRADGSVRQTPYASFSVNTDSERGLLGIVADPHYATNGFLYIYYTTGPNAKKYSGAPKNRVSRIKKKIGKPGFNEKILLDNIPSDAGNHNGGDLSFGPDGKLYVTVGDSGCGSCHAQAQTLNTLRGKILRLNPDGTIPTDNPFYNTAGARQEIWAYGFRNPWRIGLRASNHTYFVGDVGENTWEEVDVLQKGGNYGWNNYEGPCPANNLDCDPNAVNYNGTIKPIHWYRHGGPDEDGDVIAGGVFAEKSNYPAPYANAYFYGDGGGGWVHVLTLDSANTVTAPPYEFDDAVGYPVSFANGPDGNIYVVAYTDGALYKYVYKP